MVIVEPVPAEDAVLRVHLIEKRSVRQRGQDQCEGGLQAVFQGEVGYLIEDFGSVFIKTHDKGAHHADSTLVKTPDAVGVFGRFVRELMHGIDIGLRKRLEADVYTDAT